MASDITSGIVRHQEPAHPGLDGEIAFAAALNALKGRLLHAVHAYEHGATLHYLGSEEPYVISEGPAYHGWVEQPIPFRPAESDRRAQ